MATLEALDQKIKFLREWTVELEAQAAELRKTRSRDIHNETHRPLNHLSGSSFNSHDLIQEILNWLNNHGQVGDSHWTHTMCVDLDAYNRWTKTVVKATLEEMASKRLVELKGSLIKLGQQQALEPEELPGPGPEAF